MNAISPPALIPSNASTQNGRMPLVCETGARQYTVGLPDPAPLRVSNILPGRQPVTVGIPVPRGLLKDAAQVTLNDDDSQPVAVQATPLAHWSDGSVEWLLLDFIVDSERTSEHSSLINERAGIRITDKNDGLEIDTGSAVFRLSRAELLPFTEVLLDDGKNLVDAGASRIVFTDRRGGGRTPRVERIEIEHRGPIRATVRLDGSIRGQRGPRFVARVTFFAGLALTQIRLTIHNPHRARHRGGIWDLGDAGSILFRDLSVLFDLTTSGDVRTTWTAEPGRNPRSTCIEKLEIYQDSSGGENWQSRNHVNRNHEVPCRFRGYRVQGGPRTETGLRANPTVSLQGQRSAITVAIANFWQQFPKALEVNGCQVCARLFPRQWADHFELQGGEQKTHDIWVEFHAADRLAEPKLPWVQQPAQVRAEPAWYAASGAIAHLAPIDIRARTDMDRFLASAVFGPDNLLARREIIDEYGWRNYGEIYADHEAAYFKGPPPVISHYNNQYDLVYGGLVQYLRTGNAAWVDLFAPLARHVVDIDIYRTKSDRARYNYGHFWHTEHYYDAGTSTHRTYSRQNAPHGKPYGGGPCNEHNYTTGLLHYYYLTGDADAREAVRKLADWVIQMDDGRQTVFGLLDDGPTGHASSTRDSWYHGPGRGCGNSINALLDAWLLTKNRVYRAKAEELIRRSIHPNDDIAKRDLLNVEDRWSYTVFLGVLARYLDLKIEANEVDAMHAYARASLLAYATWMLEHEESYLDHPEKLEYPTETWASQDFRKANALRFAAAHADEPLRGQFLRRGDALADRAWEQLMQFETRSVARTFAILFIEGTRDQYFRQHGVQAAKRPTQQYDFGQPVPFAPQRERIRASLKTPSGICRTLARLVGPAPWRFLLGRIRATHRGEKF